MTVRKRFSTVYGCVPVLLTLALVLLGSCGEQPTAIDREPGGGYSGRGEIDPEESGSFLLGSVSDSTFAPGHIEVWAMGVAYDSAGGIVSFDVQLHNCTRRDMYPPIHFVITYVMPGDISVVEFDGVSGDGFPFYDFSSKLGGDGVLEAGERTESVTMRFHTVQPRSFAIGFRIDLEPPAGAGVIAGVVYRDDNRNGVRDRCERCEPGIEGITVVLSWTFDNAKMVLLARTDANGEYRFRGLREGVYEVSLGTAWERWEVTSIHPLLVTLIKGPDGEVQSYLTANFGLFPIQPPAPDNLFGPIMVGPFSPYGTLLDSTFTNPPSFLPVVYSYYLEVMEPPFGIGPFLGVVDSASAWINDELVYGYHKSYPPDTAFFFAPQIIRLPDGLVQTGENTIRLFTDGNEDAVLVWRVYRKP